MYIHIYIYVGSVKKSTCYAGDMRDAGLILGLGRFPWRRKWQPTPVTVYGVTESDTTYQLNHHHIHMAMCVYICVCVCVCVYTPSLASSPFNI